MRIQYLPFCLNKNLSMKQNRGTLREHIRNTFRIMACSWWEFLYQKGITVRNDWESTKPRLCSKLSLFKMPWQMLELLQHLNSLDPYLPYQRAFQWGTIWPYNSRGTKKIDQSWRFNFYLVNLDFSTLICCIFDTTWGIGPYSASLEGS